ncbi:cation:proton antiporter [Poriferisphaera sp. WC338]|uniref:cation:proton antiporter n=1 Tax=Poriferisphaera sp. WC338 TaxID=3425129 RepID=UPI003D818C69
MNSFWTILFDILLLLSAAMLLGAIFVRFRQSAIVGYLLAGTLLGPHAINAVLHSNTVENLAELGVALLLFTIGLEFSWKRLTSMGKIAFIGGALQILITIIVAACIAWIFDLSKSAALAVGAMLALSSTACVLRTLSDRAEIDSVHGRLSLGILLIQDMAVVPLVILVTALGANTAGNLTDAGIIVSATVEHGTNIDASTSTSMAHLVVGILFQVLVAGLAIGVLLLLSKKVLPRLITVRTIATHRELPILFALVVAAGSTWLAHALELSPALGAFIAGVVLGESSLSTQIRSDVASIKTLFVTLFFASIGMLADLGWMFENFLTVACVVATVIAGKVVIIWGIERSLGIQHRSAIATGLCLAQIGEFSFVLVVMAQQSGLVNDDIFNLVVSTSLVTFFLTPYLVGWALPIGRRIEYTLRKRRVIRMTDRKMRPDAKALQGHIIIVGFGPAGEAVAKSMQAQGQQVLVIDLNPATAIRVEEFGMQSMIGDASLREIQEHAGVRGAKLMVVTLPDHRGASAVIRMARRTHTELSIMARARYHAYVHELSESGAQRVIDEEEAVGRMLVDHVHKELDITQD